MNEMTFSYQTRLILDEKAEAILQECSSLLNVVKHALYAESARGKTTASCKVEFLKRFHITARQFNAVRVNLDGTLSACRAGQDNAIFALKESLKTLDRKVKFLENKPSKSFVLHHKKRRLAALQNRLNTLEQDKSQKRVRLCFGGKKLFKAQFHLEKNGFASHEEWKRAFEAKRKSEFFVLGSKDEISGNQSCALSLQPNGKFSLRLRLPKALEEKHGKYFILKEVSFSYGHDALMQALNHRQAISYRFKRDAKGWRIFATTALKREKPNTLEDIGAIGLDLNAEHIAYVETDRFGNVIDTKVFPWISYGKSNDQLKAITGDICKEIIALAQQRKKPIVIEKLNFQQKKAQLSENSTKKLSRLLSSFGYGLFYDFLTAKAFKSKVAIYCVNPAFTSVIGHINYAVRYGLSVHLAAALCIARRHLNLSEKPSLSAARISDGKGSHVAFVLPVRNRTKHVWHFWGQVKRKMKTVLAAHNQAKYRSLAPPCPSLATANSS